MFEGIKMTIKVKIRENNKAVIKFDSATQGPQEKQWFINTMRSIRDGDPRIHPKISIRDLNGEIPKLPPPKPPVDKDGKPIKIPQKLTPEMMEKMGISQEMTPIKKMTPDEMLKQMPMKKMEKKDVKKD